MYQPLPAKTVFEAQAENRRDTTVLFLVLVVLYILFFNLIALALFGDVGRLAGTLVGRGTSGKDFVLWTSAAAFLVAWIHFLVARSRSLDSVLDALGAKPADPRDRYHQTFTNLVAEAEAATNLRPIRPVLIPSAGCNAFAVADGKGHRALGVTEGLLSRLDRSELSAVVAHEASHLLHGDSRLMTTACSLFGILGSIQSGLGSANRTGASTSRGRYRTRSSGSGRMVLAWLIALAGYLLTKMVCMAISRRREFLADEHAVQICKDPLSLAQALSKISGKYRGGGGDVNEGFAPLFILNPSESRLDEGRGPVADLFSTHPPLQERLVRLMGYARMNLRMFQERMGKEEQQASVPTPSSAATAPSPQAGSVSSASSGPTSTTQEGGGQEGFFYANKGGEWFGPSTAAQLLSAGLLFPQAWVCPAGSQDVMKACDAPVLLSALKGLAPSVDAKHTCPRCRMPLLHRNYEGLDVLHCTFCKGYLLRAGYLERILARHEVKFDTGQVAQARLWRDRQRGTLKESCTQTAIRCPLCSEPMSKMFHSLVTRVVLDRCTGEKCRAVWCDGGEMETLQMLVESDSKAAGF